jgi:hypothetical protein
VKWTRCVDLSVHLPNEPGGLARLLATAQEAGVDISGACALLSGELPVVHILIPEADNRDLLEAAGFDIRAEREVLVLAASEPQEVLARATSLLGHAGVNMDICYLSNDGGLVIGIDDFQKGAMVLETDEAAGP